MGYRRTLNSEVVWLSFCEIEHIQLPPAYLYRSGSRHFTCLSFYSIQLRMCTCLPFYQIEIMAFSPAYPDSQNLNLLIRLLDQAQRLPPVYSSRSVSRIMHMRILLLEKPHTIFTCFSVHQMNLVIRSPLCPTGSNS